MLGQEGSLWFNKNERKVIRYAISLMPKFKDQTFERVKAARDVIKLLDFADEEDPQK